MYFTFSLEFEYIYFSYQDLAATEVTASPSSVLFAGSVLFTPLRSTATLLPSGGEEEDVDDDNNRTLADDLSGGRWRSPTHLRRPAWWWRTKRNKILHPLFVSSTSCNE